MIICCLNHTKRDAANITLYLARGFYDTVWNDSYFRNVFCYFSLDKDEMTEFNFFFSKKWQIRT